MQINDLIEKEGNSPSGNYFAFADSVFNKH